MDDGSEARDCVTADMEEIKDEEGIVTAASDTTVVTLAIFALLVTRFDKLDTMPKFGSLLLLTTLVSNCAVLLTAVAANSALAESRVKREVGCEEKECCTLLLGVPISSPMTTALDKS